MAKKTAAAAARADDEATEAAPDSEAAEGERACRDCGAAMERDMVECPECGAVFDDGDGDEGEEPRSFAVDAETGDGLQWRNVTFRLDRSDPELLKRAVDDAEAPVPLSFSSETPVPRRRFNYDTFEVERYNEVLDHAPGSMDMSRAADGLPLVLSHNSEDAREQVGIVENVRTSGKMGRGEARFSSHPDALHIRSDMLRGIRKNISVGYIPDENNAVRSQGDGEALPTIRYMRWTPAEISVVPIPADTTVGVGRSSESSTEFLDKLAEKIASRLPQTPAGEPGGLDTEAARKAQEETVSDKNTPQGGAAPATAGEDLAQRKEREDAIRALCKIHNVPDERADTYLKAGASFGDVANVMLAEATRNMRGMTEGLDLSEKDARSYSFSRAIAGQFMRTPGGRELGIKVDDAFELEVDAELRKGLPENYTEHGGVMIPTRFKAADNSLLRSLMARAIDTQSSTGAKGGNLIFKQAGDYLDFLWPRMKVAALGATRLAGLVGPIAFPKLVSASSWTWTGDNPGSDTSDSDPVFGQVALNPCVGQATTAYSRSMLIQAASGNVDLEAKVQNNLFMSAALGIDKAAIQGDGSSNSPTGITHTSGIGSVVGGNNGLIPTRANMIALQVAVAAANADIGPGAFLSTPGIRGALQNVFASVGGTPLGLPVWTDAGTVLGERAEVSTQVPSTLTKGTASGICHAVLYGIWSTLNVGYWGAYELVVDPYSKKKQGLIEVTNYQIAGIALEYASAFSAMLDAKAS